MLMALSEGKLVMATTIRQPVRQKFHCPGCQAEVRWRHGAHVIAHFAHRPNAACQFLSEAESAQHLQGKQALAVFFRPLGQVVFEQVLTSIQQRADLVVHRANQAIALEFQCSPISYLQVAARTSGYRQLGVAVRWILGRRYWHQELSWSVIQRFGYESDQLGIYVLYWRVDQSCLVVRYQIQANPLGRLSYQTAVFKNWSAFLAFSRQHHPKKRVKKPLVGSVRQYVTQQLRRRAPFWGQQQARLYQMGRHIAGFPNIALAQTASLPVYRYGTFIWRVHWLAWLSQQSLGSASYRQLLTVWQQLAGEFHQTAPLQFDGAVVIRADFQAFIAELCEQEILQPASDGWRLNRYPRWYADETDWRKSVVKQSSKED